MGNPLLNELVRRLNRTIEDFNEEFQGIIGDLKDNSERRHQIIHDLMEGKELESQKASSSSGDNAETSPSQENQALIPKK